MSALPSEPSVGDTLEAAARALEAVAMVMRRLAEREQSEQEATHLPVGDRNLSMTAAELGVTTPYIKKLILTGQLKGYRNGRLWRVPVAEIERFRRRRAKQTSPAIEAAS